ncbi:MAG: hypothetical protein M3457_15895 [Chloroflexota bacterium]|nr:hypothetical protein [Chloroflexota bacterium]
MTPRILASLTAAFTCLGAVPAHAGMPTADAFKRACDQRLLAVQNSLRVCVVAVVTANDRITVVHATTPSLVGKTLQPFASSGVMSASAPLAGLDRLRGRMVVIGGQLNGLSIYSARLL